MNDDEFEDKLRALTAKLVRPDPTAGWKAEILARAGQARRIRAPRWYLVSLGMAWICIVILRLSTPGADDINGRLSAGPSASAVIPGAFHDAPDTPWETIIALNSNPDFPDLP
jgi:hypothetical protein